MKKILLLLACFALSVPSLSAVQLSGDVKTKYNLHFGDDFDHWMKNEANIRLDHSLGKGWITTNIRAWSYDSNHHGIRLDKAFIGYKAFADQSNVLSIEVGQNRREDMFDSKMQHDSHFIGAHFSYNFAFKNGMSLVMHGGPCVLDCQEQEFGAVLEGTFDPNLSFPCVAKYNVTHWDDDYTISEMQLQVTLMGGTCYAAFLRNHQAESNGMYVGYTYGKIRRAHDFLVDVNFQIADKQTIPEWDMKGVTRGFQMKGIYALTDSFKFQVKDTWDMKAKLNHLELGAIYTW